MLYETLQNAWPIIGEIGGADAQATKENHKFYLYVTNVFSTLIKATKLG